VPSKDGHPLPEFAAMKPVLPLLLLLMAGSAAAQVSAGAPEATLLSALVPSAHPNPAPASTAPRGFPDAADEAVLRGRVDAALWPGDIVRAADAYLQIFPNAADIAAARRAAASTLQLVRRGDVHIYRSSFTSDDAVVRQDMRKAALGDRAAAVSVAEACRGYDEAHGTQRYVGWMQLASLFRDERASYSLALYYRRAGQPVLAAQYEAVALALGHVPAASLDNLRK
jgi:hypothetical protein